MSDTPTFNLAGGVRLRAAVGDAIDSQIGKLRTQKGCRIVGVVEIERHSILEPDDAETEPTVLLRLSALELAKSSEQEALLRLAMQALHLHRTAGGTLTEDGDLQYAQDTLDKLPDLVSLEESARLRAAFEAFVDLFRGIAANNKHNDGDLRREMKKLLARGEAALAGQQLSVEGTGPKVARKAPVPAPAKDPLDISGIPDSDAPTTGGPA